jgi:hypothetical protein
LKSDGLLQKIGAVDWTAWLGLSSGLDGVFQPGSIVSASKWMEAMELANQGHIHPIRLVDDINHWKRRENLYERT